MMKKILLGVLFLSLLTAGAAADETAPQEQNLPQVQDYSFVVTAADIVYGMTLNDSVLDASQSTITVDGETVPATSLGTFAWQDGAFITPVPGTHTYTVSFIPSAPMEGVHFAGVQVMVTVRKAQPVISQLPAASPIVYGQSLGQSSLTGGTAVNPHNASLGSVQGTFDWEVRDMVPSVGQQQGTVVFTPIINDADLYDAVYLTVPVQVNKLSTQLTTLPVPDRALVYGEALSALTLSGGAAQDANGADVPGTFTFAHGAHVPSAGAYTADCVFTPLDAAHRESVAFRVTVQVEKASLTLTANEVLLTYGQALGDVPLSGNAVDAQGRAVSGAWQFADGARVPGVADSGTAVKVVFTPEDSANYVGGETSALIRVQPAQVHVTFSENWKYEGMQDGAYAYTVQGLPDGVALDGAPVRESGENVGEYVLSAERMTLPAEWQDNYVLTASQGVYSILPYQTGARAQLSPAAPAGEKGWYNVGLTLTAPAGYEISLSRAGDYAAAVSAPESASGTDYYLRVAGGEHDGALSGVLHVDYRLDMTPPTIEHAVQSGNYFTLVLADGGSGLDRIYGMWSGEDESYGGAATGEFTSAAREAGDYTYVVYDLAGNNAVLTLDFADADGDRLTDVYEQVNGLSETAVDTDGDSVSDYDARWIRILLERDRLDVAGAALLGSFVDESERSVLIPEGGHALLVPDDTVVSYDAEKTDQGLMRRDAFGAFGRVGNVVWHESTDGIYAALCVEGLADCVAMAPHMPNGLAVLCGYDAVAGKATEDIRLLDMASGTGYIIPGTAGSARFDISPDGRVLAYAKDGTVTLLDVASGSVLCTLEAEVGCIFQFEGNERLMTGYVVIAPDQGVWQMQEAAQDGAWYLDQPVQGSADVLFAQGDKGILLRVLGSAEVKGMDTALQVQAASCVLAAGETLADAYARLQTTALTDAVERQVSWEHLCE